MFEKYHFLVTNRETPLDERLGAWNFLNRVGDETLKLKHFYPNDNIVSWIFKKIPQAKVFDGKEGKQLVYAPFDCEIHYREGFTIPWMLQGITYLFEPDKTIEDSYNYSVKYRNTTPRADRKRLKEGVEEEVFAFNSRRNTRIELRRKVRNVSFICSGWYYNSR